jgi:hypothetical protein
MTKKAKKSRSPRKLSTLDDFLAKEGKREEFEAVAVKEVLAWQIGDAMKASNQQDVAPRICAAHEDKPQPGAAAA